LLYRGTMKITPTRLRESLATLQAVAQMIGDGKHTLRALVERYAPQPVSDFCFSATQAFASSLAVISLTTRLVSCQCEYEGQQQRIEADQNDHFDSVHRRFSLNDPCDKGKGRARRSLGLTRPLQVTTAPQ
jgi:hypothetical protein